MQTSYAIDFGGLLPGMLADSGPRFVESFLAGAAVPFGTGLQNLTATPGIVTAPASAANGVFAGVALHVHAKEQDASGVAGYADEDTVSTLRRGRVWVQVADAVVLNSAAYVVCGGGTAGQFTDASSSNLATGGVFRTATSGAGLALLEINLP